MTLHFLALLPLILLGMGRLLSWLRHWVGDFTLSSSLAPYSFGDGEIAQLVKALGW